MSTDFDAIGLATEPPARWRDRVRAWSGSVAYLRATDTLIALAAASLPWSTTALAVFMLLWLVAVIPTIDGEQFMLDLAQPAFALPIALVALAVIGMAWSETSWAERLQGIKPLSKLLLLPFLLGYFQRSQRGLWVFASFLLSCTLLMILSWIVLALPQLKLAHTASGGVPVKNYLDQSQEFALCAFALALPALTALRARQWRIAAGAIALMLLFVANMLYVVSARTALVYMPVLLILFASLHLSRRATRLLFAGVAVTSLVVWTTSPYLRQRIADVGIEYRAHDTSSIASTAQRLTYWRKSVKFIAGAPWLGHGTGAIRHMFTQDAVGQTGLEAEVINNPHNQTLNVGVQWGLIGILLLYAMWTSHVRLFAGRDLATWIGLAVVVQNITSSLLNSHLADFHEGWMYVIGVGVAGGMALRARRPERILA
ncbi:MULTISPECIES: O-antigen ligase family protein [Bradyrhizobium]|uniref:O-antigen ligase family protein n=1 Tax=Bradyrhizobium TaxID=374 RepID=UPI00048213CB|nr:MULTISPECIES: O-antigen ligase family protein [Bradyrhizobium]MCS3449149.1 O-antigen ligase [Bradyrhizobium elkanii]MCS3559708.1 O-antigen ligase [Bradyrhizobium elkanii]MCW2150446.1 O-antigen ligase [Bradyrhizobium elkanii]MCW2359496.1 O-antigen ligase [Bradyrhizobium elkanii]MCW2374177.1 O-antigen ligase [Bradyrhizobium elkanii]